ncbi:type II secretion system protein [Campylobacter pinnipediorum]|uniref:type II secretion system protein n=1 Tax=Campylobacter pinnipediorum TaxID=1965231 RepID=UPI00084DFF33|nr:type II secretion system protein [Campylobacter pinnipediorum]
MTKRAFTTIELIFVIAIVSILAFFAIPKFFKIKDEAHIVTATKNLKNFVDDVDMYYAIKTSIAPNLKDMTNVKSIKSITGKQGYLLVAGKECIKLAVIEQQGTTPAHLAISKNKDKENDFLCKKMIQDSKVQDMINSKIKYVQKGGEPIYQYRSATSQAKYTQDRVAEKYGILLGSSNHK